MFRTFRPKRTFRAAIVLGAAALALSACVTTSGPVPAGGGTVSQPPQATPSRGKGMGVADFSAMVKRMEPVAEAVCRERAPKVNCDYKIIVDSNPNSPPNAYQTIDVHGQPTLTFTVALIAEVHNVDELAFVMGHEAAHHVAGHLSRKQQDAVTGGLFGSFLGVALGADASSVEALTNLGASVGARSYSKAYELEADQLGTIITAKAGFNPVRGAAYFTRIPDPGDRFLGSHPPNAARIETVRRTMANM